MPTDHLLSWEREFMSLFISHSMLYTLRPYSHSYAFHSLCTVSNHHYHHLFRQYDGDKWDAFYEDIPISLLHHTNGNGIYNTSHPLLERLTGQLEVEAPCPYNSIPYDYRMSQMWVEGTLGIVPQLAPKIMLSEEGENITLSDNKAMFTKWANSESSLFFFATLHHNHFYLTPKSPNLL